MALSQLCEWVLAPFFTEHQNSTLRLHRRLLVISGRDEFCHSALTTVTNAIDKSNTVKYNLFTGEMLKGKKRKQVLGSEWDIAFLDCRDFFRPGDVMAVAGTVKQHGCLILICPPFTTWPENAAVSFISEGYSLKRSLYLARFIDRLQGNPSIAFYRESATSLPDIARYEVNKLDAANVYRGALFKSYEQEHAFNKLSQGFYHNQLNALITAPRGRGKSSLLGLFIQKLIREGHRVLLTSERQENVKNVFDIQNPSEDTKDNHTKGIEQIQPATLPFKGKEIITNGTVKWVPPDSDLLSNTGKQDYDVVIVDEAASLPLPLVHKIIKHNKQWILSTTLLGYEGSGSGFIHKLLPNLPPSAIHLTLTAPLRWYQHDPLETFLNETCLFESDSSALIDDKDIEKSATDIIEHSAFNLSTFENVSEQTLQQIMSLLALAHYQTTPDDFMRLMDSPDVLIASLSLDNRIIAASIINIEGGKRLEETAEAIASGKRRPKGHLGAQRLCLLSANGTAATFTYWRINRIAVHTRLQGKGIGSELLRKITNESYRHGIDAICTSYGTTAKLDVFWCRNGFEVVDYGRKPNKASGETSALAVLAHTNKVKMLISELITLQKSYQSTLGLFSLPTSIINTYQQKLHHFIDGSRTLDDVWPILCKIAKFDGGIFNDKPGDASGSDNANSADSADSADSAKYSDYKPIQNIAKIINENSRLIDVFVTSNIELKQLCRALDAKGLKEATKKLREKLKPAF